jgi:hypothetical protein
MKVEFKNIFLIIYPLIVSKAVKQQVELPHKAIHSGEDETRKEN